MCCLFGLLDYNHGLDNKRKSKIISVLSEQCEERGMDATGIAYIARDNLHIFKRPLAAHKMHFYIPSESRVIMGHTRMTTQGNQKYNENNHPFGGRCGGIKFALAHNGVLHNDKILREQLELPKTRIQTDSYIAVQLLEAEKALNFDSLKNMAETVEGSFTFTVLDSRGDLYFVKGINPICIYHFKRAGFYLYASTEGILQSALRRLRLLQYPYEKVSMDCGDILRISGKGQISREIFETQNLYDTFDLFPCRGLCSPFLLRGKSEIREEEEPYLEELREMAGYYGFSPECVDALYERGFSCEEIEDGFYEETIWDELLSR